MVQRRAWSAGTPPHGVQMIVCAELFGELSVGGVRSEVDRRGAEGAARHQVPRPLAAVTVACWGAYVQASRLRAKGGACSGGRLEA